MCYEILESHGTRILLWLIVQLGIRLPECDYPDHKHNHTR